MIIAFFSFKKLITSLFRLLKLKFLYERVPVYRGIIVIQAEENCRFCYKEYRKFTNEELELHKATIFKNLIQWNNIDNINWAFVLFVHFKKKLNAKEKKTYDFINLNSLFKVHLL
jgi:hypothetical protein